MALVVGDHAFLEPLAEAVPEEVVLEVLAPQRAVADAGLGQGAVQIQHADQAGPGAAPVGDGEDRAAMGGQAGQDVMAVLPDALGHDQRGIRVELAEHLHAHLLRINEAVLLLLVERMRAHDRPALGFQGLGEDGFHLRLLGPAFLVGREAQVAAGNQVNVFGCE